MMKVGSRTPWGPAQTVRELVPGVVHVTTAEHGGLKLDRRRNAEIPAPLRHEGGWYEEDESANIPEALIADLHETLSVQRRENARQACRDYFPDQWMASTGEVLTSQNSRTLDERDFWERHANDIVVRHGRRLGDGLVECSAVHAADRYANGPWFTFLVPEAEYDQASRWGFVIDLTRHVEVTG